MQDPESVLDKNHPAPAFTFHTGREDALVPDVYKFQQIIASNLKYYGTRYGKILDRVHYLNIIPKLKHFHQLNQ